MKVSVNRQDFLKSINTVIHVSYNKSQRSILECILIEADYDRVTLNAFDTVTAIETSLFADIEEDGVCAIPAKLLAEVVSKMPDGNIELEKNDESGITISSGGTCIRLQEMDERQFPRFPEVEGETFVINKEVLKKIIDKTVFSVYQTPDKPIFTGLLFEIEETNLNVVGIDGVRMAKRSIQKLPTNPARIVIPSKAVKEAARLINDDTEENITVVTSKKACFFLTQDYKIYTRLLEGEFMNYNNIIPPSFKTRIRVNAKMLENSLNMVSVISRDQSTNPVKLTVGFDTLTLTAKSEYGNASDNIPILLEGETISIFLNAKYMMDALRVIDEEEVYINLENSLKPCVIKPVKGEDYLYLIVPLNIKD